MIVVAAGNAFDGITVYGPFDTAAEAFAWADVHLMEGTIVSVRDKSVLEAVTA